MGRNPARRSIGYLAKRSRKRPSWSLMRVSKLDENLFLSFILFLKISHRYRNELIAFMLCCVIDRFAIHSEFYGFSNS